VRCGKSQVLKLFCDYREDRQFNNAHIVEPEYRPAVWRGIDIQFREIC